MLRAVGRGLAVLLVLALLVVLAHVVGRSQCPPPDWWVSLFAVDGDWACVR